VIFDHLPKCGGLSLYPYLDSNYPQRKIFTINGVQPEQSILEFQSKSKKKKSNYFLIKGHLANELFEYIPSNFLKITMLRDPIDRVISHYFYAKNMPHHYLYSQIHSSNINLEQYVSLGITDEVRNWYTTHFSGLPLEIVKSEPEISLTKAITNILNHFDLIGFLDEYFLFATELKKIAGYRKSFNNIKINTSKKRLKKNEIASSIINKIEINNEVDILLYAHLKKINKLFITKN